MSSIDWISLHQVTVPCVNDEIQPQIDKCASWGKLYVPRRVYIYTHTHIFEEPVRKT